MRVHMRIHHVVNAVSVNTSDHLTPFLATFSYSRSSENIATIIEHHLLQVSQDFR